MPAGIVVERDDPLAVVVLDRAEVMNRFEGTMREDLLDVLTVLGDDSGVRALMITGAGGNFSAGADIDELVALHQRGDTEEIGRRVALGTAVVRCIRSMPKPIVAAVDGNAAGAGINLALACDVRVGSARAVFTESFVRIGLVPDWGGMHSLVRLVGAGRAADLMMTGERVDAVRAEAIGILQRVFPTETFLEDARGYASRLARGPTRALAAIKAGLWAASAEGFDAVAAHELAAQPAVFGGADCLAGLRAFLAKEPPTFTGTS